MREKFAKSATPLHNHEYVIVTPLLYEGAVPRGGLRRQEQRPAVPRPVTGHVQGHPQPHETAVPRGQPS